MAWIATAVALGTTAVQGIAAKSAADTQAASTREGTQAVQDAEAQAREDLTEFREAGERQLPGLEGLIGDPEAQKEFVTNNPFFTALADDAQKRIFQNQAARGKVASGGTAEALQNSILLLGSDLVNKSITQRQNLVNTGANAAARMARGARETGRTVADLATQRGNAEAAGTVGLANAITSGASNIVELVKSRPEPTQRSQVQI